jgi:hypothetical protein
MPARMTTACRRPCRARIEFSSSGAWTQGNARSFVYSAQRACEFSDANVKQRRMHSSCPAKAGKGDHPKGGGSGVGLNETLSTTLKRRVRRPFHRARARSPFPRGTRFFVNILKDAKSSSALDQINHQRNNLAHGRQSASLSTVKKLVADGLQLGSWSRIADTDGVLRLKDWWPWVGMHAGDQIGLFERWQKNQLRYLVPETGKIFRMPRDEDIRERYSIACVLIGVSTNALRSAKLRAAARLGDYARQKSLNRAGDSSVYRTVCWDGCYGCLIGPLSDKLLNPQKGCGVRCATGGSLNVLPFGNSRTHKP